MELKYRKLIANKALPKFGFGFTPPSLDDTLMQAQSFNHPSTTQGVTTAAGAFKAELMAKNAAAKDLGGMPSDFTKAAPKGDAGQFLKNNAGGIANAAMSAINFASTIGGLSKNTMSSDEMMGSGGTTQEYANGIGYTKQRVDESGILNQIDAEAGAATMSGITPGMSFGASTGSLLGPIGGAVGGAAGALIGGIAGYVRGKKAKEEAERQKEIAINRTHAANILNRELAYTTGLRNDFNRNNITDESLSLFHANDGTENWKVNPRTGETYKKGMMNTAFGPVYETANAKTKTKERIISALGPSYVVKNGPHDNAKTHLYDGDSVISANEEMINPSTGRPIIKDANDMAAMNGGFFSRDLKNWLDMNLKVARMLMFAGKRKEGDNSGYLGGTLRKAALGLENALPLINAYGIAAQRDARAEGGLRAPKSYVANPYEQDALQQLNSLHSDYYPIWAQNRELEAGGKSAIVQSGGLSAGQRMLGYMGITNKTQQNNAAALFEHQGRENALKAQAANAALQAGLNAATRQQQAYQWDEDMSAKAHTARENMLETSAYDRQNALTQFFKNLWENNQFNRTMALYQSQQKNDEEKTKAIIESLRNNDKSKPVTLSGVADNAAMISIDPETGALRRIDPFSPRLLGGQLKNPLEGFKLPAIKSSTKRRSVVKRTKKGK